MLRLGTLITVMALFSILSSPVRSNDKGEEFALPGVKLDQFELSVPPMMRQRTYHDPRRGWVTETCEIDNTNIEKCSEVWRSKRDITKKNIGGIIRLNR